MIWHTNLTHVMLSHYRRDPSVIEVHGPSSWQRRLGGSSTCGPQYARRVGGVRLCGDRELSLGSSPTDLPSAGPGPSGLNTALGSDGQGQTSFSSVFFDFFWFCSNFYLSFQVRVLVFMSPAFDLVRACLLSFDELAGVFKKRRLWNWIEWIEWIEFSYWISYLI